MSDGIESLVHFMADIGARIEGEASEERHPKPKVEEEDEVKRAIKEMLVENIGCSILDSGSAYGRGWEKNRSRNFDEEEAMILDVDHYNNEVGITYNIYHYLINFLEISEESERLNIELQKLIDASEDSYMTDIDNFLEEAEERDYTNEGITNTYNYDNILNQILQYGILINDDTYEHFIILQIHNGCDARGGYTKPRVFSLGTDEDEAHFRVAQEEISAFCEKCHMSWYTDDSGYTWYNDGNCSPQKELDTNIEAEEELNIKCDQKKNMVCHKNCNGIIRYSVMESW